LTGVVSAGREVHRDVIFDPGHTEILLERHDSCPAITSLACVAVDGTGSDTVTLSPGLITLWSRTRTSTFCQVDGAAADGGGWSAEATTARAAARSTTTAVRVKRMRRSMRQGSLIVGTRRARAAFGEPRGIGQIVGHRC